MRVKLCFLLIQLYKTNLIIPITICLTIEYRTNPLRKRTNSDSTVTSFPHLQTIIINYYKSSGSEFRVNIIQLTKPGTKIWLINRLPAGISIHFRVSFYVNNLEGGLFVVNCSCYGSHLQMNHSNGWFTVLFLESLWYNDVFANDSVSRT